MGLFHASFSETIKSKATLVVKVSWLLVLLSALGPLNARPQEEEVEGIQEDFVEEFEDDSVAPGTEALPPIEAKLYFAEVIRVSSSMRIYLLRVIEGELPVLGKIILLRMDGKNAMAFRVLQTYPNSSEISAVQVRKYEDFELLEEKTEYRVIEKVADLEPLTPSGALSSEGEANQEELDELEESAGLEAPPDDGSNVGEEGFEEEFSEDAQTAKDLSYDPDLDEAPSDVTLAEENQELDALKEKDLWKAEDLVLRPKPVFERYQHGISVGLHYFLNSGRYLSGFGIRYGTNISKDLFMDPKDSALQDVLTLEFGLYNYAASAIFSSTDSFNVLPILGVLRYNIFTDETLSFNIYGGLIYNLVLSSQNAAASGSTGTTLGGIAIATGAGVFFRIGPQWFIRVEGGLDGFGGGLVLRF